jgi:GntR family transcriptional regulator, rspAB operon transcriptional repressor
VLVGRCTGNSRGIRLRDRLALKPRISKADHVYLTLRQGIIEGDLPPGAPIDKTDVALRLSASRSPITIAVNRLAHEGLVRVEPQHGSFVAPISSGELKQLMILRRALEAESIAEATRLAPADLAPKLDRNLAYQKAALAVADHRRFYELDVEFHRTIVDASGWTKFNDVLGDAHAHLERARRVIMPVPGHLDATWAEHAAIAATLKKLDPEAAAHEMRRHLDRVTRQFEVFAAEHPALFGEAGTSVEQRARSRAG